MEMAPFMYGRALYRYMCDSRLRVFSLGYVYIFIHAGDKWFEDKTIRTIKTFDMAEYEHPT